MHMTMDINNNLYVAEYGNDRVQKFTSEGKALMSFGETGKDKGEFDAPSGVAVDVKGYIYVTDFYNHYVNKFPFTGTLFTK